MEVVYLKSKPQNGVFRVGKAMLDDSVFDCVCFIPDHFVQSGLIMFEHNSKHTQQTHLLPSVNPERFHLVFRTGSRLHVF